VRHYTPARAWRVVRVGVGRDSVRRSGRVLRQRSPPQRPGIGRCVRGGTRTRRSRPTARHRLRTRDGDASAQRSLRRGRRARRRRRNDRRGAAARVGTRRLERPLGPPPGRRPVTPPGRIPGGHLRGIVSLDGSAARCRDRSRDARTEWRRRACRQPPPRPPRPR
jgi:hypothetical protein